jgi:hypothetical protein
MKPESRTLRVIYFACAIPAIAFLVVCLLILKFQPWLIILFAFVIRMLLYYLNAFILTKRQFPAISELPTRWSTWDYIGIITIIALIVFFTWFYGNGDRYYPFGTVIILSGSIPNPWNRSPRFVLTEDTLFQNEFNLKKRQLAHLHSIELLVLPRGFRINFSEDYSIKIPKGGCTNRELCDFVNKILEQSPVEADVHPEAREFLGKHASKAADGSSQHSLEVSVES